MASKNSPLGRKDNIVVQELEDEVLIYDLKENKAFCLNETSALVWQMCDGNNSVSQISQQLSQKLNSPATEDLVWLAIDQLKKDNLLANSEEIIPEFNGLSRREVIRKVGLASMVAIPVVASLVAPTAAMAQSFQGVACSVSPPPYASNQVNGCVCQGNGNCFSDNCCKAQGAALGICKPEGENCDCPTERGIIDIGEACVNTCSCFTGCCGQLEGTGPFICIRVPPPFGVCVGIA